MKTASLHPGSPKPLHRSIEDGLSGGLSLGLLALTLPSVGYSLVQLSRLLSDGNLEQAVRAFVP